MIEPLNHNPYLISSFITLKEKSNYFNCIITSYLFRIQNKHAKKKVIFFFGLLQCELNIKLVQFVLWRINRWGVPEFCFSNPQGWCVTWTFTWITKVLLPHWFRPCPPFFPQSPVICFQLKCFTILLWKLLLNLSPLPLFNISPLVRIFSHWDIET